MGAELKPHFFDGGLAFMFETKYTVRLSKWSRYVVTSVFRMHVGLYMLVCTCDATFSIDPTFNRQDHLLGLVLTAVFFLWLFFHF